MALVPVERVWLRRGAVAWSIALASIVACSTPQAACPAASCIEAGSATLTDAVSGAEVCGASVVASAGASTYAPQEIPAAWHVTPCPYAFYFKGAGTTTFTVSVTAPGYKPGQASNVDVAFDDCGHAQNTHGVAIQLVPSP